MTRHTFCVGSAVFYFFLVYMTPEATSNLGSSSSGVSFKGGAARGALLRGQASLEGRLWRGWRIDGVDNLLPPLMIGRLTSRDPGPFHLSVAGKKIHPAGGVDWWISTPSSIFPLPLITWIVLPVNCELFPFSKTPCLEYVYIRRKMGSAFKWGNRVKIFFPPQQTRMRRGHFRIRRP